MARYEGESVRVGNYREDDRIGELRYKVIQYLVDMKDSMCCSVGELIAATRLFDDITQLSSFVNKQDAGRNFCLLSKCQNGEQLSSDSYWIYLLPVSELNVILFFFTISIRSKD
jgi:hypothetical protein